MRSIIIAASLIAGIGAAQAQAGMPPASVWRPLVKQCVEDLDARVGAAAGASWQLHARCAVQRVYGDRASPATLNTCIGNVEIQRQAAHDCAMCGGDPVEAVLCCVGGAVP